MWGLQSAQRFLFAVFEVSHQPWGSAHEVRDMQKPGKGLNIIRLDAEELAEHMHLRSFQQPGASEFNYGIRLSDLATDGLTKSPTPSAANSSNILRYARQGITCISG